MSPDAAISLSAPMRKFILHWGEMGDRWGINRTVAQCHALIYISEVALHAEQMTDTLSVARSNVSTSLRELLGWGVIREVSMLGDRRKHYESLTDVWEMFRMVVSERKRRELDPTFVIVRECLEEAGDGVFRYRLEGLVEFFDTFSGFYEELEGMDRKTMERLFKAGTKLSKLFGGKR